MISFTKSQLVARFPEFANEADARVANLLTMARDYVDETVLGSRAMTGLMLYTAHLLSSTKASAAGKTGPIISEKVGDLSTTYAGPQGKTNSLQSTTYGELYLKLVAGEGIGIVEASFPASPLDI